MVRPHREKEIMMYKVQSEIRKAGLNSGMSKHPFHQIPIQSSNISYVKETQTFHAEASDLEFNPGENLPEALTLFNEKTGQEALFQLKWKAYHGNDEVEAWTFEMVSCPAITFKVWND